MSFWSEAKEKVLQAVKPRQQENQGHASQRADGSTSGYVPGLKPNGNQQGQNGAWTSSWRSKVPEGVYIDDQPQSHPVGGQTGQVPPQQGVPQPGMPQQPHQAQNAYQQPNARPQAQYNGKGQAPQHNPQQPVQPPFGQNVYQQPVQTPQGGYAAPQQGAVPPQQPMQQPVQQANPQTYAFPGGDSYMVDGHAYKMVMRVAQITGVSSCFRVIEFMYNNEAVIVNAEQVTDLVEADRCMDLIFGAACAMQQRLMRVSGKQIYLITPPQIYVAPFEQLRRMGMEDIERRWPGALQSNMQSQPMVNNVQQMPTMGGAQPMGAGHPMQQMYNQPRQDDFGAGMGRRVGRMNTNGYTDYNGFGNRGR